MSDVSSPRLGAPDAPGLEPMLVPSFGNRDTARPYPIPRSGLLLGRDSPIFGNGFEDMRMSVKHAEVRLDGDRVLVRDLTSETGTRLNGRTINGEHALAPGDVLRLGDTLLVYAP